MRKRRIRAVILDIDGVVYIEDRLLPSVASTIHALRRRGIRVLFATNNASLTRTGFARKLSRLGIPCAPNELMNAALAAADWLRRRMPRGSRIQVFGNRGLATELRAAGLTPVWCHTRAGFRAIRARNPGIRSVCVAFDTSLTHWDLCAAHLALQRGASFVACNLDSTWPVKGHLLPGTGSLVRLLQEASGQEPILIGKPSPELFRRALAPHRIAPRDAIVVGDRLDIDVAGGKALGTRTALVLTGVDTRADIRRHGIRPDAVLRTLSDLLRLPGIAGSA